MIQSTLVAFSCLIIWAELENKTAQLLLALAIYVMKLLTVNVLDRYRQQFNRLG